MQPSATAERTPSGAVASDASRAWAAASPPIRPSAKALDRSHVRVGILQPRDQGVDGLRVAADAERIDHAHQQPALQLAQGLAQGGIRRFAGDRFQGDPRPGRKLLVRQERGQGRHRLLFPADRQVFAGDGLFRGGRGGFEDVDQLGLIVFGGAADAAGHGGREHGQDRQGVYALHGGPLQYLNLGL